MPSIALHNLGCSKNTVDGERILTLFKSAGYAITGEFAEADVIVVNTCAFIREAQEEAIETILESASWKKNGRCRKLIVSGCFSERHREKVTKQFPEVDLWVGVHDWEDRLVKEFAAPAVHRFERELQEPFATQHLKIAEGCSHACSYCVIPHIRGTYHSRPVDEIVAEAKWLESRGVRELILVAQDTSFYGRDMGSDLPALLRAILGETGIPWIRLMYLHPSQVKGELLRLIAAEKRICPYFDLPLQHAADPILSAMGRAPLSKDIRALVGGIRAAVPDAAIRSAFILGFPGETEQHFEELLRFVEDMRFDRVGIFPYSAEEGTPAAGMHGRPRSSTVQRRSETLMLLQADISREKLQEKVGSVLEVIIDGPSPIAEYPFSGRTGFDAPEVDGTVLLTDRTLIAGSILPVRITGASDHDLIGEASGNLL